MHFIYYRTIAVKCSLKIVKYYLQKDDGYNNIIYTVYNIYTLHKIVGDKDDVQMSCTMDD